MKYRIKDDVSASQQLGPDLEFKAGVHEATEKTREALELLAELGLAERLKTADKEA